MSGYDIIGDVHGQARRLERLLEKMGYRNLRHPDGRKIIFLGDFIDRGTENARTIDIVRSLMEEGTAQAVMGNHEFNAICYARKGRKGYIRPHTSRNTGAHAGFLQEFPFDSKAYRKTIKWFETLPVYLENRRFRVIHACWNDRALKTCGPYMTGRKHRLKRDAYAVFDVKGAFAGALNTVLKGPEFPLPDGLSYTDAQNAKRRKMRLYWWMPGTAPANDFIEKGHSFPVFNEKSNNYIKTLSNKFNYQSQKPVFIGHYNIPEAPFLTSGQVACVNFKNYLVAYRWDEGDKALDPAKLVCV